jgi:hypothetical protein
MRRATAIRAGLLCSLLAASQPSIAQEAQPFLLALRGQSVIINYTPGALDRAVHVQRRLELVANDFARWSGTRSRLRVFILSRDEWGQVGFHAPFGIPGHIPDATLAVPSYGDAGTVELWTRVRGVELAPLPGTPIKGTAQEAASLALSDLLMEVEAARVLLSVAQLRGESPWLHQVLAHLIARQAFETYETARMPEITAFFDSLAGRVRSPLALDRYTPGLDLETLLWFESRFQDGAREVMASGGRNQAKQLVKRAGKTGGVLTEADFFARFPEMRDWLARSFDSAPATAP